jgi:hypothetical protein
VWNRSILRSLFAPGSRVLLFISIAQMGSDKLTPMMRRLAFFVAFVAAWAACGQAQQAAQSIEPPQGSKILLEAKASGAQMYVCSQADAGFKWTFKGPDAKLFDASGNEIGTHFAGPTWKLTDGSQVQGELMASQPSTAKDAMPWLLIRAKPGTGTGKLASVAFIRRTETHGGLAPATGCQSTADLGKTAQAHYTATYSFYTAASQ